MRRLAVAGLALVLLAACNGDKPIRGVVKYPGLEHKHVAGAVSYPQTPPVGGPHNQVWLRCGTYTEPAPNENAVHSMEHGAVWITYQPSLAQADLDLVHRLAGLNPAYVLISPYEGLPSAVVASAWGLQLQVAAASDPRLAKFVKRYAGGDQGGEAGTHCADGATLDQIRRLDAGQQPSGVPSMGAPVGSPSATP
jgi:hypothetical protein